MEKKINSNIRKSVERIFEIVAIILVAIFGGIVINYALYQTLKWCLAETGQMIFVYCLLLEIVIGLFLLVNWHANREKSILGHLPQGD